MRGAEHTVAPCYNALDVRTDTCCCERKLALARLTVIGAGAWGTVIAQLLAGNGHEVTVWLRDPDLADSMRSARVNERRLPGIRLHDSLRFTTDPHEAAADSEAAFTVVPSAYVRPVLEQFPAFGLLISCTKGFSDDSLGRMSGLLARLQPGAHIAALSGPNLAREIAEGQPAAAVVASEAEQVAAAVQGWLQSPAFRVYTSTDLTGVETGGAIKNVIALATGFTAGLGLGENTRATIITRGLHELVRLGTRLGGARETFYGLSGLGDMIATCAGPQSRNFLAGSRLARGDTPAQLEQEGITAEGISTVERIWNYALQHDLDLPICREVAQVIFERKSPAEAVRSLMERSSKPEAAVY